MTVYTGMTLSGLPGSGKSELVKHLHVALEWKVYAIGNAWRAKWRERHPDGAVSFEDFWRASTLEDNRAMNLAACERFQQGNVIADSRYSAKYCQKLPMLHVFLYAGEVARAVRNASKHPGKDYKEVRGILLRREEDELQMGKQLYGASYDYRDRCWYHLILNTGKLSIEEETSSILSLLKK